MPCAGMADPAFALRCCQRQRAQSYTGKACAACISDGGHLHRAQNGPGRAVRFAPAAVVAQAGVNDRVVTMIKNRLGRAAFQADAAAHTGRLLTDVHRPASKHALPAGRPSASGILHRSRIVHGLVPLAAFSFVLRQV